MVEPLAAIRDWAERHIEQVRRRESRTCVPLQSSQALQPLRNHEPGLPKTERPTRTFQGVQTQRLPQGAFLRERSHSLKVACGGVHFEATLVTSRPLWALPVWFLARPRRKCQRGKAGEHRLRAGGVAAPLSFRARHRRTPTSTTLRRNPDEQRPQAQSLHSVRGERPPACGDLDRGLGVDGGHGQANGAWHGRATAARRLRGRRRLDSLELASAVSRPVARHQGGNPMAAGECRQIQPRPGSDRDHGRQFRRLDDGDGRGDR